MAVVGKITRSFVSVHQHKMKTLLLVICGTLQVLAQTINKEDTALGVNKLQKKLSYLRKDIEEIRELMESFFSVLEGEGDKIEFWYDDNRNSLTENRRLLEEVKEKFTLATTYFNTTKNEIAKLRDNYGLDSQQALQRTNLRADAIGERLRALDVLMTDMLAGEAKERTRLQDARANHTRADARMVQAEAVLQGERAANTARMRTSGAFDYRVGVTNERYQNMMTRADDLLTRKSDIEKQLSSVMTRAKETEENIKKVLKDLQSLKEAGIPSVTTTVTREGVNYIKSIKTATGKGKRIKLVLLSD